MCFFSSPSAPAPPPLPPPLPAVPTPADPVVGQARTRQRQRAALAGGRRSTILTGGRGLLTPADTARKTILGA